MIDTESEGVLSRWSRRKLEAGKPIEAQDNLQPHEEKDELSLPDDRPQAVDEPLLTDEDMPPIESLGEDSDFSMFMSPGVSDKLRNLALRKMFHVPSFNIRDGLDEYDEDYTEFEALGDIVTCDMKHQLEMQEKKRREQQEAEASAGEYDAEAEAVEDIDDSYLSHEDGIEEESYDQTTAGGPERITDRKDNNGTQRDE